MLFPVFGWLALGLFASDRYNFMRQELAQQIVQSAFDRAQWSVLIQFPHFNNELARIQNLEDAERLIERGIYLLEGAVDADGLQAPSDVKTHLSDSH